MVIFIVLLVLAVLVLAAAVLALADPKGKAGMWCAGVFKDVCSFIYTELGTVLKLLKHSEASGKGIEHKYSPIRIAGLALVVVPTLLIGGVGKDLYQVVVQLAGAAIGAFLLWYAAQFDA
jgi:hypothetical protein